MKNKLDIFKKAQDLLDEPEVQELLAYCDRLEDEIVDFKFEKTNNKELILLDMVREVIKGCNAMEKEQLEHERFGFEVEAELADFAFQYGNYVTALCMASINAGNS